MKSSLRNALEEYLTLRRRLGFDLSSAEFALRRFVEFMEQHGASFVTTELALRWAKEPTRAQPDHWARRLGFVRRFAQYRKASDPRTEVPPAGLLPHRYVRKAPHIYRPEEIARLLQAARQLPSEKGLRPRTYSTLMGLMAVTGMRVGECIALNRNDADLKEGVMTIVRTKFRKSRLVPIHSSTRRVLKRYASVRDRLHPHPSSDSFFLTDAGLRPVKNTVEQTFVALSHRIGLRRPHDSRGPRLHDLRHRFAVRTVLGWYKTGVNVEQRMPILATYLGHTHVADTYWYLSAVPELLQCAAQRLGKPIPAVHS